MAEPPYRPYVPQTSEERISSQVEGLRFELQELAWEALRGTRPSGRLAELLSDERELTLRDVAEVCVLLDLHCSLSCTRT